jgi:hypothetical protein
VAVDSNAVEATGFVKPFAVVDRFTLQKSSVKLSEEKTYSLPPLLLPLIQGLSLIVTVNDLYPPGWVTDSG